MSEWIEWSGGKQPVADDVVVEVRYADGDFATERADMFRDTDQTDSHYDWWEHRDGKIFEHCFIAAYRLA